MLIMYIENMPNTQLEHAIKNRPRYFKQIKDMLEAHELKAKNIHFRTKLLQDRRKASYQNEYDRLRGAVAHTVVSDHTVLNIRNRMKVLEMLGASALPDIR